MMRLTTIAAILIVGAPVMTFASAASAQVADMSFFVTSVGKGTAPISAAWKERMPIAHAGKGSRRDRHRMARLSEHHRPEGDAGINARDRIGKGPWKNVKGDVVANSVDELHSDKANLSKETSLTEKGELVKGRGDDVNMHDILTGSDPMGLYSTAGGDTTCGNWTKNSDGSAIIGHHDRRGLKETRHMMSWNSSHGTAGCGQEALKKTGGSGLFYCFLAN